MENNFVKEKISYLSKSGNYCVAHKFEEDCIIPDYNAEIMRIIDCKAHTDIMNKSVTGDKLTLDFSVLFCVIYQSYDMCIYTYKTELNYVKTIDIKDGLLPDLIDVRLDSSDTACKATGKRRIELKGAVKIDATAYERSQFDVINTVNDDIEAKIENLTAVLLDSFATKYINLKEEINEDISALNIIDSFCKASLTDYRIVADKVVVKGEVECFAVTMDENLSVGIKKFSFQFGQILDAEGVSEEHKCDIDVKGISCRIEGNECGIIVKLSCKCYKDVNISYVNDGFSVKYESECSRDEKRLSNCIARDKRNVRTTVSFGRISDEISDINYFNVLLKHYDASVENGNIIIKATANCSYIGSDSSKTCVGFEKSQEFEIKLESCECPENATLNLDINIIAAERSDNEEELVLNIEAEVNYQINKVFKMDILNDITVSEENRKEGCRNAAITIYYAEAGESIFEIAKRYNTYISGILEENDLEGDRLYSNKHLIIPLL